MGAKLRIPVFDFLEYLLVRAIAGFINGLPMPFSTWIARRIGDSFYLFLPLRKKVALDNLNIAFKDSLSPPQKNRIVRETFRNLATSLMEFFRTPSMLAEASQRFEIEGTENLDKALEKGNGVIFVVSHLGSWEYLAFLFYLRDYSCAAVVREIRNHYIYQWIQALRIRTKMRPIDRVHSVREILRTLKKNHLVAVLIDQWAGRDGLWMDFFSEKTSTTSLPVRLARKTGAALIPGYCVRTALGRYKIIVKPEVPVDQSEPEFEIRTTERLNRLLEDEIRHYPEQWTWTHRRWKGIDRYKKK